MGNIGFNGFEKTTDLTSIYNKIIISKRVFKDGSSREKAVQSTQTLIDYGIKIDGMYWIDIPTIGPLQVYCDLSSDSKGWILMMATGAIGNYGKTDAFWYGNRGSNESFTFDGNNLTTATTELLIKYLPYKKLKIGGSTFIEGMVTMPNSTTIYNLPAHQAYKQSYLIQEAANNNTTHAQKMTNLEVWTAGINAKMAFTYNQTWNEGYNAGSYLVGMYRVNSSAYGDYYHVYLGGNSDRRSLSSALWLNRTPGGNYPLHDSPTTINCGIGTSYHRGGGNHWNDSWWIQQ